MTNISESPSLPIHSDINAIRSYNSVLGPVSRFPSQLNAQSVKRLVIPRRRGNLSVLLA